MFKDHGLRTDLYLNRCLDINIIDRGATLLTNYTDYGLDYMDEKGNICAYIDNLCRLNLVFIETGVQLADDRLYEMLIDRKNYMEIIHEHIYKHTVLVFEKHAIRLTNLGRLFKRACFNQEEV